MTLLSTQPAPNSLRIAQQVAMRIDRIITLMGNGVCWCAPLMILLTFIVVFLRYGLNIGAIALQEAVTYLHSALFMLGIAVTLQCDRHVRIDIFYRRFSTRTRALINCAGHAFFLLPLCILIGLGSWDYVVRAWVIREVSTEAGGIPAIFLLKSFIPLMAFTLILQGIASVIHNICHFYRGKEYPPHA